MPQDGKTDNRKQLLIATNKDNEQDRDNRQRESYIHTYIHTDRQTDRMTDYIMKQIDRDSNTGGQRYNHTCQVEEGRMKCARGSEEEKGMQRRRRSNSCNSCRLMMLLLQLTTLHRSHKIEAIKQDGRRHRQPADE